MGDMNCATVASMDDGVTDYANASFFKKSPAEPLNWQ